MKYPVQRNHTYDFIGQSYASRYPNIHKYPATMLPQIGIEILKELKVKDGTLLDPYCGSGSSFISGLDCGMTKMVGFDINPLAVLISKVKFTKIDVSKVKTYKQKFRNAVYEFVKKEEHFKNLNSPNFYHVKFWFSDMVLKNLSVLKYFLEKMKNKELKRFFLVPFSETIRECSYTRNHEFKLYKMKSEDILNFNPDVFGIFFDKLNKTIEIYQKHYLSRLSSIEIDIENSIFKKRENHYDVVLTSPPYGDSKTTVAYGQFSLFSNQWLGIDYARKIDGLLMGGKTTKDLYQSGLIGNYIQDIAKISHKRALEVSSFYQDLEKSIYCRKI